MSPKITRPVLRYPGGKFKSAPKIIEHFGAHDIRVEPFGGAFSVTLRAPRVFTEVYNDRWDLVANVFRVLRNPIASKELERQLTLTPFSRTEYEICQVVDPAMDAVEKARRVIFRSFAAYSAEGVNPGSKTTFRSRMREGNNSPAVDFMHYAEHIDRFRKRLQGVIIENMDYQDVIDKFDSPKTLIFLDPPYVHDTRHNKGLYACEFTDGDHIKLGSLAKQAQGMVIVNGYSNKLYEEEIFQDWHMHTFDAQADGQAEGSQKRTEVLWLNDAAEQAYQARLTPLFASSG
ncbi:MAG TPA: DNA methyltransferase [Cytophagales bacterium]|nr:DNA methyltransferase [Cytophagales bacterium]HAA23093.1 DNA methyltransferase [Cytophagales bacterium]HAP64290.1 DNA methyltransferase [Cytophagales bacterium]